MQKLSIQCLKEGSLAGHCWVSVHANEFGWQKSLWKYYKEFVCTPRPLLITPVWQQDNLQYVKYALVIPFLYGLSQIALRCDSISILQWMVHKVLLCTWSSCVWEMGNNWKRIVLTWNLVIYLVIIFPSSLLNQLLLVLQKRQDWSPILSKCASQKK